MDADPRPSPPRSQPGRRVWAMGLLVVWVVIACALISILEPPPDPPAVDPQDQAIRDRMANWAVRDAERWDQAEGDLSLPWAQAEGHLAIVIDDVGRELEIFDKLLDLRFELSFSVLPGSVYAPGVQQRLRADLRRPREILLHLPMEPMDPNQMLGGGEASEVFLLATDTPAQLQTKLAAALERVPSARGINNHMGSRLTTDAAAMAALMPTLRDHELYFLDSRTTPQTLAATEAQRAGVPTLSRKVFLDHEPGREAIAAALELAATQARIQPTVAIGHPSVELAEVLAEQLERLHQQGVVIYPVSRILAGR